MNRYICIHGHFYQPPRENPWLEEVEQQDSAYPYHDWNQRISSECYGPNTASRILDSEKRIVDIVNNYTKMSFNFGPTLLFWIERHEPGVYQAIVEADRLSQMRFSGHGAAIAQVYNHMIMPLANGKDKRTQVIWGLRDFEYRFGRKPEGMWLSETAVDIETLEMLAEQGMKFTILSPRQAQRTRKIGGRKWTDVSDGKIDTQMPYLCRLPSGKTISLFFYNAPIAYDVAFGSLLNNGEAFAKRLMGAFAEGKEPKLVHIATDGETYGHHHRFGDMALAYCLHYIENNKLAEITVYGEYLEKHPLTHEAKIVENSSWSCIHGVKRWKDDCGCNTGMHPGWHQKWRISLREAMDWLRDTVSEIYEEQMAHYTEKAWLARDAYVEVVLQRSEQVAQRFLSRQMREKPSKGDTVKVLKLMEMQRHAMAMYASCGWYFDDISGIEAVQIMRHAARVLQLANEVTGRDLESTYVRILEHASSNSPRMVNGSRVYEMSVKPAVIGLSRVGAQYAISSMLQKEKEKTKVYCYTVQSVEDNRTMTGEGVVVAGRAALRSEITLEEVQVSYVAAHLGDHNLIAGVREFEGDKSYENIQQEVKESLRKGDASRIVSFIHQEFGSDSYSLWHLFKDEQRRVLNQIVASRLRGVEAALREIYTDHYGLMQVMNEMHIPLPRVLATAVESVLSGDLRDALEAKALDTSELKRVAEEVKRWSVTLDGSALTSTAKSTLNELMLRLSRSPHDIPLLQSIWELLGMLHNLSLEVDTWEAQNIYFSIGKRTYEKAKGAGRKGDKNAQQWTDHFDRLGDRLGVKIDWSTIGLPYVGSGRGKNDEER